jgi:hypothetical protein
MDEALQSMQPLPPISSRGVFKPLQNYFVKPQETTWQKKMKFARMLPRVKLTQDHNLNKQRVSPVNPKKRQPSFDEEEPPI